MTGQRALEVKGPETETYFTMQGKYKGVECLGIFFKKPD